MFIYYVYTTYGVQESLPTSIWQPWFHCIIGNLWMKSLLWFWRCRDRLHLESGSVCGRGMRCNDCTQHALDGSLSVCTMSCTCCVMPVLELLANPGSATQTNAILLQNGFSHFFSMLSRVLYSSPAPYGHQCHVYVPNNNHVHFSHEVFVVGISVNASSFDHHIWYTRLHVLWFNMVSCFICSGTALRLEI